MRTERGRARMAAATAVACLGVFGLVLWMSGKETSAVGPALTPVVTTTAATASSPVVPDDGVASADRPAAEAAASNYSGALPEPRALEEEIESPQDMADEASALQAVVTAEATD